jgi:hypothetical protein
MKRFHSCAGSSHIRVGTSLFALSTISIFGTNIRPSFPLLWPWEVPVLSRWDDDSTPNLTIVGDATAPSQLTLAFPANGPLAGQEILPTLQSLIELTAGIVEAFRTLASE